MVKLYTFVCSVMLLGCMSDVTPSHTSTAAKNNKGKDVSFKIEQNDDNDGGVFLDEDADPAVKPTDDVRVAVAYCASQVVTNQLPSFCSSELQSDGVLITDCDNGVSITWSCEKCGSISKNGTLLGHMVMHSNTNFQINPANTKQAYFCELSSTGHEFKIVKNP